MVEVPGVTTVSAGGGGTVAGSERFEIRGKLGAGGVGVVYRAFDRQRGTEVALKTLRQVTGADLYRFKREFRTLADVNHPNLVKLHELHTRGDEWFLTMELVAGVSFIDWVRPCPPVAEDAAGADEPEPAGDSQPLDLFGATGPTKAAPPPGVMGARQRTISAEPDLARIESSVYQLADTVHALHQAGKLHRDLKPSNVLVEADGRVVVLDFGLITEIESPTVVRTHTAAAVGTPAYMSPEQAADLSLTPASDWYAVGVMLYEALTGRRPFDVIGARGSEALRLPPPRRFAPATPEHLDRLCMELLQVDPARRPEGGAVLRALGREPSAASQALVRSLAELPFVGREAEIASLRGALADVRGGACVAVFVRGASGMGKTSLLRRFLDESAIAHDTIVLRGRCYERESVPFKTLDGIVDALVTYLLPLSPAELARLLPRDMGALARLFPVLMRIPAVAEPVERGFLPPDPLELRQRAFDALRHLLARMASRRPVVLAIDDVQWGDADSGTFFAELLHHSEAPALLLIACHRSEDEDVTPLLAAIGRSRAAPGQGQRVAPMRELTLGPLADGEARQLLANLSPAGSWIDQVVRESGGSPMFLAELAHGRTDTSGDGEAASADDPLTLEQVIGARVERLPAGAQALLAVCAAAGRPLRSPIALAAAGLEGEGELVASLCADRLLRVRQPDAGRAELETYHDRIRATVLARLGAEARRHVHAALAAALEGTPDPDHEALVGHLTEAGDLVHAARHASRAALDAENRMAFHRAAELYAVTLAHGVLDDDERRALRTRLAHALAFTGHLDEAAATFALAATDAPPGEKLELERLELEQLLRGGRLVLGLDKSRAVLAAVGHRLPGSPLAAIASLLAQRMLLRLRGLEVDERPRPPLSAAELQRVDVLWSLSSALGFVNPVYGQVLQMSYLREALASREPRHVGLAFCLEMGYLGLPGEKRFKRLEALFVRALAIAERTGDKELLGVARAAGGLASFLCGRWRECSERLVAAELVLRNECTRVRWQLDLLETFRASVLWFLGETRELARLVPIYLRAAEERGDAYALRGLRGGRGNNLWLVLDQPAEARAQLESVALPRSPDQPAHLTHFYELLAHTQIDLYEGHLERAQARVEDTWGALKHAMLLRIQNSRVDALYLRARAALAFGALHANPAARRPFVARAQACARQIDGAGASWAVAYASVIRATIAHQADEPERAADELRAALSGFAAADMHLFVAATRHRLGTLLGGDEGAAHVAEAEAFLRAQAIVRPLAMVKMLAPGW
jgi:hypothetical protein